MAYEYYVETAVNCVFICHTGDYAIGEGMRAMIQATKKPEYQRGMNFLRDMQQTNFPSEADFANLIFTRTENEDLKEAETKIGTAKLAWLIGDRDDYILAHQVCVSSRVNSLSLDRKPFRDIEKAREWLEIPEDYEINFLYR